MEALFRNETLQLVLIGLASPVAFFTFIVILGAIASLFPEPRYKDRRQTNAEDSRFVQRPAVRRPNALPPAAVQPVLLQMNKRASPQMTTGNTSLPYWQYTSLPPLPTPASAPLALPKSSLPQLCVPDEDDDDDEPTNPLINMNQLLKQEKITLSGVPVLSTLIPDDEAGRLLKRLMPESDGVDWRRAILLRDGVPMGYPGVDCADCVIETATDDMAKEIFDAVCGIEEVETRELSNDEGAVLQSFVEAIPVMLIE